MDLFLSAALASFAYGWYWNGENIVKGIILAAGKGTRLYPMTKPVCKPLLPIYDKPMIYYPLAVLLQAGIRKILIITPPGEDRDAFERLLGNGSQFGAEISYAVQPVARGIADALLIGEEFIAKDRVCLVLGDNLFYSDTFGEKLRQAMDNDDGATIFGRYVEDPRPFGVVEFDAEGRVLSLEEKPQNPKSNYIVPGLYFYDSNAIGLVKQLTPSARGELEITDLNIAYMRQNKLKVVLLDQDFTWLDAGTADSLLEAAETIAGIQRKTGKYVACLEEIALQNGYISKDQCRLAGEAISSTAYGRHLIQITGN